MFDDLKHFELWKFQATTGKKSRAVRSFIVYRNDPTELHNSQAKMRPLSGRLARLLLPAIVQFYRTTKFLIRDLHESPALPQSALFMKPVANN